MNISSKYLVFVLTIQKKWKIIKIIKLSKIIFQIIKYFKFIKKTDKNNIL